VAAEQAHKPKVLASIIGFAGNDFDFQNDVFLNFRRFNPRSICD